MNVRRKHERPKPCGSHLLTDEENQQLFRVLGKDRIALSAGVSQLICAGKNGDFWIRLNVGVAVLVKDYIKRSYVITLYDVLNNQVYWNQKLYKNFQARCYTNCPRLIVFEGDDRVYGLNFSDSDEASSFKEHLNKRLDQELKTTHKEQHRFVENSHSFRSKNNSIQNPQPIQTGITAIGTVPHFPTNNSFADGINRVTLKSSKKDKKRTEKKLKTRKEDIGNPIEFRHLVHVGWDQDQGLKPQVFGENPLDDTIKTLLLAAGQNPDEMPNDEIKYAYKFIQRNFSHISRPSPCVDKSVNEQVSTNFMSPQSRLALTHNNSTSHRHEHYPYKTSADVHQEQFNPIDAPTLSYSRGPLPPIPQQCKRKNNSYETNSTPEAHSNKQSVGFSYALEQNNNLSESYSKNLNREHKVACVSHNAPPPPPPPPPQLFGSNNVTPKSNKDEHLNQNKSVDSSNTMSNLLQEIQQGTKLKRVSPLLTEKASVQNAPSLHDNIMTEIKQGTNLKHIDHSELGRKSVPNIQDLSGMAGALARALEQRRKNLANTDSEDGDLSGNDSEWEEN